MNNSALILERIKFKEAIKYADSLSGVIINSVISVEEIPSSIPVLIQNIISIQSVATTKIPNSVSDNELAIWLDKLLYAENNTRVFFRPNELYWKFWIDLDVVNINKFIIKNIVTAKDKGFYLSDINGKVVKALLDEEYSFDFFIQNL